jgi:hypothetical protein
MPYLLLSFVLLPFLSNASSHVFMPLVSFHLDQKSLPGYGMVYQYKYNESFELDIAVMQSNDLQTKSKISGSFTSASIGTSFIRPYNDVLTIKAGIGLSHSLSSSNQRLITDNQTSPYIKLSAKYRVTPHLDIELGQSTVFSSGNLGNNHSLFLGVAWTFGTTNNSSLSRRIIDVVNKDSISNKTEDNNDVPDNTFPPLDAESITWTVQLAAYKNLDNANKKRLAIQQTFDNKNFNIQLIVVEFEELHRLVSSNTFVEKSNAKKVARSIFDLFSIESFVTSLNHSNTIND